MQSITTKATGTSTTGLKRLKFGSVCSGIEAASVAFKPLGWTAQWFSEIEPFPCSLLAHHYPETPNFGDMTKFESWPTDDKHAIDILCGGTPCQSFSVAGLRKGLDDPRGNLMLTFGAIAAKYRPKWLFWENVPGVLSSNGGRDFGSFLGMLGQLGYGFAYKVYDAEYFGVAQRRRRVFVVGCLGDWHSAAAVLFERHSLQGNPAPSRKAREGIAGGIEIGPAGGCYSDLSPTLRAGGNKTGGDRPPGTDVDTADSLIAYTTKPHNTTSNNAGKIFEERTVALDANSPPPALLTSMQVRRLTPTECERLQGFPDGYTAVTNRGKPAADGPRYKALGNSWAVPNVAWIGRRIQAVDDILESKKELEAA